MRLLSIYHINDHNFEQEMNMCHMMKFVLPRYLYQSMHMASPSLPSVETSYSFGREMIHSIQWMHPTPCVLSETALSGLQFIILAWHEAGKIPAADSILLFFPLCYNSTFFVWLSLDLGPCLTCRIHARHWKPIHVWSWFWTSPTHRQSIHQADYGWKKTWQYTKIQLVCLATLQEKKPGH